jgi:hypothetical protein
MLCIGCCLALSACGSGEWGNVSGTVSVDGEPLKTGTITFHPVAGGADAYGTITGGSYSISTGQDPGLKTGQYQVMVSATTIPESGSAEKAKLLTPAKYATPQTSDLKADVHSGSNRCDFKLNSSP